MSESVEVTCGDCGQSIGDQYHSGDGLILFKAHVSDCPARPEPSNRFKKLLERSSLGTPEAKRLRASVSPERAAELVRRAEELRGAQS